MPLNRAVVVTTQPYAFNIKEIFVMTETDCLKLDLFLDVPTEEERTVDSPPIGTSFADAQNKGSVSDGNIDF